MKLKKFTEWHKEKILQEELDLGIGFGGVKEVEFKGQGLDRGSDDSNAWVMHFRLPGTKTAGITSSIVAVKAIVPNEIKTLELQMMLTDGMMIAVEIKTSGGSIYRTIMPKQAMMIMHQQVNKKQDDGMGMANIMARRMQAQQDLIKKVDKTH